MKPIEQDEIYQNLNGFLKSRGIELTAGSYAQGIQKTCSLLTDAVNLSQKGLGRAKVKLDEQMEHMRQVIHEKTAPKPRPAPASSAGSTKSGTRKSANSAKAKSRRTRKSAG